MAKKGPPAVFEVVFSGPDLYPEKIPLGTLAATLSALQRMSAGKEFGDEEEDEEAEEQSSLRLLNVVRGSAVFRFACPAAAAATTAERYLRLVGDVLQDPEKVGNNDYLLNPIERLSTTARTLQCSIIVKRVGDRSPVLARIEPTSFETISKSLFVEGDTSLSGEVKRVGGATKMRCALRVPFQHRLLFCTVAAEPVARKLGDNLYKKVVVQGKARWIKGSWRVHAFRIDDVKQLKQGSLREAFGALREAGGKGWDTIPNPAEFIQEVTGP
jgi:hypothetical protein